MKPYHCSKSLVIVLMIALVIRILVALYLGDQVSGLSGAHDEISYDTLAQRFITGHGLTFPRPWYPWIEANAQQSYFSVTMSLYLAAIYATFGYQPVVARLVMAILSTLIVGAIFLLARHLFGERVAFISGLIAAGYAYFIFYGVALVTETPFMLALLIAILLAYRIVESPSIWLWGAFGGGVAITVLLRMAVLFYIPALVMWIAFRQRGRWTGIIILVAILVLAVSPFTVRNYYLWGKFLLLESQFGHVFWNGNHPDHQGNFNPCKVFPIPEYVLASKNEAEITNRLLWMGIENVRRDPTHFFVLTMTRLRELFKFWPTSDSTWSANALRVLSFGVMLPFALVGLLLNAKRWRELMPILLFLVIHTGIYAVSWTMIRYRIPLDALLVIFAAFTVNELGRFAKERKANLGDAA